MSDVRIMANVRIPMRDGVHLAATVYLPPATGPASALLWYTPYIKDGMGGLAATDVAQRFFAGRGFAAVSLDFRGYGESDGVAPAAFADQEALDGYDALEWIARQPWCSGRTGIWGASYGGNTALAIAALRPPSLGAIVPIHAIDTEFTGAAWPHGCRGALVGEVDWGARMIGIQLLPPLRFEEGWRDRWRTRLAALQRPFPFAWHSIPPETWTAWTTDIAAIEVPTLAVSAWHDSYPRETVDYHDRLRGPKRLVLGPWKHELPDFAVHDPIGFFEVAAGWFGRWLGHRPAPDADPSAPPVPDASAALAPVTFFEQLGRGWRSAGTWPPSTAIPRTIHAHPDGRAAEAAPATTGEITHVVDPTVGLAALPWDWTTPTPLVPADISADDHRSATWTTDPFTQPLLITGLPDIVVALRSDRPDVPVRAWLSDVRPDGFSTLISHGWVRPWHILGGPLPADRAAEIRVPLSPTCYRLPVGHRLRISVAGSHFPALVPPPDPVTFRITTGPAGTRAELQVEPVDAVTGPTPAWPAPIMERATAPLEVTSTHSVERSLDDDLGQYRQTRRSRFRLGSGAELTWELEADAVVARSRPAAMRLESRQVWRVLEGPVPVEIRVELIEGLDEVHVSAEIDVDGRPFFGREWATGFDTYPWRIRR
jgi:putative CocE/NonD family hydrolase